MNGIISLTPEELFFLGEIMEADFIDYSYIEAMNDIQARFDVIRKEAIAGLGEKGLIKESISGRLKVRPLAEELMGPVFFGEKETVAIVFRNGKTQEAYTKFFHFRGTEIISVTMEDRFLQIEKTSLKEIENYARTLVEGAANFVTKDSKMSFSNITDIVKVKKAVIGVGAENKTWCIAEGVLFGADEKDNPIVVNPATVTEEAVRILKGE